MAILTTKSRPRAPLETWVLNRFGGEDAKQALCDYAEWIVQAAGSNAPPVDLLKLARKIGIDPWPIYEPGTEGAIKIVNGRLRIVLRTLAQNRQTALSVIGRSRFTYAHELGHALFYDLESSPPVRLAPEGFHRLEEQLCNKVASRFLVPEIFLQSTLSSVIELSPELLRDLADKFQTSIQAMAYRVAEAFATRLPPDRFYMLSANVVGIRGTALKKPRCLICILPKSLTDRGVSLLQAYQGIDAVKRRETEQNLRWSLQEYFQQRYDRKGGVRLESEEMLNCPGGSVLEVKACHRTLDRSSLVWSEGTIRALRLE